MTPKQRADDILDRCWADTRVRPNVKFEGLDVEIVRAIEAAVAEEREACALLWDSIDNHADDDLKQEGCGAMGAILRYRDAIRVRGIK